MNLNSAEERESILSSIRPDQAASKHDLLLEIFEKEIQYRKDDADFDYYENLYWCGFLLFCIGDMKDIKIMWEAKHINMDTACGFDVQNLIGAGFNKTIEYCESKNLNEISEYLVSCDSAGDFEEIADWKNAKIQYFYGV